MVRRDTFINFIRKLGYSYKSTQKRTFLYRKTGGTHFISVPKADNLGDAFVMSALHQAGVPEEKIKLFLASAKS